MEEMYAKIQIYKSLEFERRKKLVGIGSAADGAGGGRGTGSAETDKLVSKLHLSFKSLAETPFH